MKIIEPHIHMVSRTTDDYRAMALSGIRTVTEPAFWAGFDRASANGFRDYFDQLTVSEPARAAKFGVRHYCWLCLNPKEAEDVKLAEDVLAIIPEFLQRPTVLGIGEIGLNKNTKNELKVLERQVELAAGENQLVLVHTPHLEDKLKGTRLIMDVIQSEPRIDPQKVLIDHAEEHTIGEIKNRGFWVGLTLYPVSKCSPARAVDMLETHGTEMTWVDSAADWGASDPLATLKAADEMMARGHSESLIEKVFYHNPKDFLAQSPKFESDAPSLHYGF
ncbi:MAG: metal-dependent hydrolase [Desulfobacteraceae bacterium]|nr:MAG: metal-dependent hydrolase [Desulfobacteraceae bacterium]